MHLFGGFTVSCLLNVYQNKVGLGIFKLAQHIGPAVTHAPIKDQLNMSN